MSPRQVSGEAEPTSVKTASSMNRGNMGDVPCRMNRLSGRIRRISGRRKIVAPIRSQGKFLLRDKISRINELRRDAGLHQDRPDRSKNWVTINRLNKHRSGRRREHNLALLTSPCDAVRTLKRQVHRGAIPLPSASRLYPE